MRARKKNYEEFRSHRKNISNFLGLIFEIQKSKTSFYNIDHAVREAHPGSRTSKHLRINAKKNHAIYFLYSNRRLQ